jgi:hypothetical protein
MHPFGCPSRRWICETRVPGHVFTHRYQLPELEGSVISVLGRSASFVYSGCRDRYLLPPSIILEVICVCAAWTCVEMMEDGDELLLFHSVSSASSLVLVIKKTPELKSIDI